jgi:hypothetical protein
MLSIHHETIKRILPYALNMRKVNFKWVPHTLDNSKKAVRRHVSRERLNFLESRTDRSLSNGYIVDETWVYLNNPRTSMRIAAGAASLARVLRIVVSKKPMF